MNESFSTYMSRIKLLQMLEVGKDPELMRILEQKLGRTAVRHATLEIVKPCNTSFTINKDNIESFKIVPGKYNNAVSVQYDSNLKGDDMYEAWLFTSEEEPRRYLTVTQVKNVIKTQLFKLIL